MSRTLLIIVGLTLLAGCAEDDKPYLVLPHVGYRPAPVDTTVPGELAEGKERAFGLPIPREFRVLARQDDVWHAEGPIALEHVANYVRDRVEPKKVETGPSRTMFVAAKLKSDPKKTVHVTVARRNGRTLIIVRDRTPKLAEKGLSQEERWRQAGIGPDGKPIGDEAK